MARRELRSNDVLLFIGTDGVTYPVVVCLTSNSITRTTAEITTSSKCGPSTAPGAKTNSVSFEGNIVVDPDSGETSIVDLIGYYIDDTTIYFKMGEIEPSIGSFTYFGSGFISALSETYAVYAAATFSDIISLAGLVTIRTVTSFYVLNTN